jgi:hypothetical protein
MPVKCCGRYHASDARETTARISHLAQCSSLSTQYLASYRPPRVPSHYELRVARSTILRKLRGSSTLLEALLAVAVPFLRCSALLEAVVPFLRCSTLLEASWPLVLAAGVGRTPQDPRSSPESLSLARRLRPGAISQSPRHGRRVVWTGPAACNCSCVGAGEGEEGRGKRGASFCQLPATSCQYDCASIVVARRAKRQR